MREFVLSKLRGETKQLWSEIQTAEDETFGFQVQNGTFTAGGFTSWSSHCQERRLQETENRVNVKVSSRKQVLISRPCDPYITSEMRAL